MTENKISENISKLLTQNSQTELLETLKTIPEENLQALTTRISEINWADLTNYAAAPDLTQISPSRVMDASERNEKKEALESSGTEAYRQGKVAALMVAGGQGTRLGYNGPKGCYEVTPQTNKPLYQVHAEKVIAASKQYKTDMPLVIMTSPATDTRTREFFSENNNFGLSDSQILIFSQGTVPTCSIKGQALFTEEAKLLENPDGHGGCYAALLNSGTIDNLKKQGVEYIIYIQVDNILAPVDDPVLIGLLETEQAEMATKVLPKVSPTEKVGNLVKVSGSDAIVEYTELTPEQSEMKDDTGEYLFRWGSPAMHAFAVSFFSRLESEKTSLPFHRSRKPVKTWKDGKIVEVEAWKNEKFIFDLIPMAKNHLGLAIERDDEFAPVKNASGTDSAESAVQLFSARNQRWLESLGINCSKAGIIEIDHLFASTLEQLKGKKDQLPDSVEGDCLIS